MTYIYIIFLGYLVGSLPTAYILLKKFTQKDITSLGSKNVGAMNTFEVTNSKLLGLSVFFIDFLKGLIIVLLTKFFISNNFILISISLISAVFGHCFSIWIKFKGGRGLSTAAGGMIIIAPAIFFLWVIIWLITYLYKKNIHFSNISTSFLVLLLSFSSVDILSKYSFPSINQKNYYSYFISAIMLVIIAAHAEPLKNYLKLIKNQCRRTNVQS